MHTSPNCKGLGPAFTEGLREDAPCVGNINNSLLTADVTVSLNKLPVAQLKKNWRSWSDGKLDNFPFDAVYWPNKGGDTAFDLVPGRCGPHPRLLSSKLSVDAPLRLCCPFTGSQLPGAVASCAAAAQLLLDRVLPSTFSGSMVALPLDFVSGKPGFRPLGFFQGSHNCLLASMRTSEPRPEPPATCLPTHAKRTAIIAVQTPESRTSDHKSPEPGIRRAGSLGTVPHGQHLWSN